MTSRWSTAVAAAGLALSLQGSVGTTAALAQNDWPKQRITIVIPFSAGTGTDAVTRILADAMQPELSQPIVIENRPGAGGTLGATYVARQPADGYTLLVGGNTVNSAAASLFKNLAYDPLADFTPISPFVKFGSLIGTNPEQPFKTIQELVAYAKANPGKITYGHGNSTGHITGETMKVKLGIDMIRLPYKSVPPALTDLMGNSIQLVIMDFVNGIPLSQSGKIVPLAVISMERSSLMPTIPTMHETVIRDFEVLPWVGLYGPAKLPEPIVKRLSDLVVKTVSSKDVVERINKMGIETFPMESGPFQKFVKTDKETWANHAKVAGIQPQ